MRPMICIDMMIKMPVVDRRFFAFHDMSGGRASDAVAIQYPNSRMQANQVILMPDLPLTANISRTVSVTGTVNGAAFTTSFDWTPGN